MRHMCTQRITLQLSIEEMRQNPLRLYRARSDRHGGNARAIPRLARDCSIRGRGRLQVVPHSCCKEGWPAQKTKSRRPVLDPLGRGLEAVLSATRRWNLNADQLT